MRRAGVIGAINELNRSVRTSGKIRDPRTGWVRCEQIYVFEELIAAAAQETYHRELCLDSGPWWVIPEREREKEGGRTERMSSFSRRQCLVHTMKYDQITCMVQALSALRGFRIPTEVHFAFLYD